MNPYTFEDTPLGPRMSVIGDWTPAHRAAFLEHGATGLQLNHAMGWSGESVDFLTDMANHLLQFKIIDFHIKSVEAVHTLRALRSLDINTYCRTSIDLGAFPVLGKLALEWRRRVQGLHGHASLADVWLNKPRKVPFEEFATVPHLARLRMASTDYTSLDGVGSCGGLVELGVYASRRLVSIEDVERLTSLVRLGLQGCRALADVECLAALAKLEVLNLGDMGRLRSLACLRSCTSLRELYFYGTTVVEDGDLGFLDEMPELRSVAFAKRRHYNRQPADFQQRTEGS